MTASLEKQKAETIVNRLFENMAKVRFGSAACTLKIHDGRVTETTYTVTESTRDREGNK